MGKLRLVTDRAWMRNELSQNAVLPVESAFGYEIPKHETDDIWWIPQGIGTRFLLNGVSLTPQAPGPHWLESITHAYSRRNVFAFPLEEVAYVLNDDYGKTHFWKFGEAKVDWFPGEIRDDDAAQKLLAEHDVPKNAVMQISQIIRFGNEYRFFVRDGKIATSSIYLLRPELGYKNPAYTYYDLLDNPELIPPAGERQVAHDFLQAALKKMDGPDGYVVDVAFLEGEEPCILEANPAWCSAWYGCNINEVVKTVVASYRPNETWQWRPDPYMLQHYRKMQPLPRA